MTTLLPPNVKVHLALGFIDMRKGTSILIVALQSDKEVVFPEGLGHEARQADRHEEGKGRHRP